MGELDGNYVLVKNRPSAFYQACSEPFKIQGWTSALRPIVVYTKASIRPYNYESPWPSIGCRNTIWRFVTFVIRNLGGVKLVFLPYLPLLGGNSMVRFSRVQIHLRMCSGCLVASASFEIPVSIPELAHIL